VIEVSNGAANARFTKTLPKEYQGALQNVS
jgi:hypothetical protein